MRGLQFLVDCKWLGLKIQEYITECPEYGKKTGQKMEGISKSLELMVKMGENRVQLIKAETKEALEWSSIEFEWNRLECMWLKTNLHRL